tara:strand:+ start:289 stop:486 length:198 start_codon:yes stop_codon:yes gene_type:complete
MTTKWKEITDDLQEFYDYVKPKLDELMERADCQDEMYCFADFHADFVMKFHDIRGDTDACVESKS